MQFGKIERCQVIPRTWFHSFFSRKKSEIQIAFTFFEKWKVKNKFLSLFFESWKWNSNGSRSRTRSENLKKISRILEKRESRWGLTQRNTATISLGLMHGFSKGPQVLHPTRKVGCSYGVTIFSPRMKGCTGLGSNKPTPAAFAMKSTQINTSSIAISQTIW